METNVMELTVGICDDEPVWLAEASRIIADFAAKSNIKISAVAFENIAALEAYKGNPLDAVFMDIVLNEDGSGIDAAGRINERWTDCKIVYLTNYLYYATEVYNTDHVFFMVKEQFEDRIGEIIGKIIHEREQSKNRLVFSLIGGGRISLSPEDILYFERIGRRTAIATVWGTKRISGKISELENILPGTDFVRCHNSYIVYMPAVREIKDCEFIMRDGTRIMISRSRKKRTREEFSAWAMTRG